MCIVVHDIIWWMLVCCDISWCCCDVCVCDHSCGDMFCWYKNDYCMLSGVYFVCDMLIISHVTLFGCVLVCVCLIICLMFNLWLKYCECTWHWKCVSWTSMFGVYNMWLWMCGVCVVRPTCVCWVVCVLLLYIYGVSVVHMCYIIHDHIMCCMCVTLS